MGRTVINQTENKQTVILNDSPAGIEGGYFDDAMVWHELKTEGTKTLIDTDTDCSIFPYVTGRKTDIGVYYNAYQNFANNRRFIATMKGDHPLPWSKDNGSTFETSEFYPIKLPDNVTSIKVTINPSFQSEIHLLYWDGEKYVQEGQSSWLSSGDSYTVPETEHDLIYMLADVRRDSNNTSFGGPAEWGKFLLSIKFDLEV